MANMLLTEDTFQPPIGWLNAAAPKNVEDMLVTEDTSHPEMSPLNPLASLNASLKLVS